MIIKTRFNCVHYTRSHLAAQSKGKKDSLSSLDA